LVVLVRAPPRRPVDRHREVLARLSALRIDTLVVIGGDGTMRIAGELMALGVEVVGVPKTIDNDLMATDLTFGFNTAVQVATDAVDRLHTTAESHDRVMILEVMGRNAGWIALHAGIAGGAHVILIPEIPYDPALVVRRLSARYRQGLAWGVVVIAEGAMVQGGAPSIVEPGNAARTARLGGAAARLEEELRKAAGLEIRVNVLGHVQRGGTPTPFDRVLATRFGVAAVDAVAARRTGTMVALRGTQIVPVPLMDAVGRERKVDPRGEEIAAALALGIELGT
jgi:6-phosphofructokinase 1